MYLFTIFKYLYYIELVENSPGLLFGGYQVGTEKNLNEPMLQIWVSPQGSAQRVIQPQYWFLEADF